MAKKKKNPISSIVVFALLGLLIASFALWGVGGSFLQQGAVVAEVGDQKVTTVEFANSFDQEIRRYSDQLGTYFDRQQALDLGIHRAILDQLIDRESLDQEAADLGLLGSDEEIQRVIMELEAFHDITGNFSRFSYESQLRVAGFGTPKEFEDQIRIDVARTQLIEAITQTIVVPKTLLDTMFAYRKESRQARIATIPASVIDSVGTPDEETVQAYYELNQDRFMYPEYRNLSFIILDPANFAEAVDLTDDELQAEYEYRFDDYNTPELRTLEAAILDSEDAANELYARVQAGEDFAAVAAEISGFSEEELVIGERSYFDIERDFNDVAAERIFNAPVGGITEPTSTLLSWQVFHITNMTPGIERPFEQVVDELRQSLAEERGIDALLDMASLIDDEIRVSSNVEQIAESLRLEAITVTTSIQGQSQDGNLIAETDVFPYLSTAFQQDIFEELEVRRFEETDIEYVVQVNEIIEPVRIPLEEIRDQVVAIWVYEQQSRIAGERASEGQEAALRGESLESIAARYGGVSFETGNYRRDRVFTQRELDPAIASLLFSLEPDGIGIEADARGDGYILLQVIDVTSLPPEQDVFEYAALLQQVQVEMRNDVFVQFQKAVEEDLDITINDTLVDQLFDPDFQQTGIGAQ